MKIGIVIPAYNRIGGLERVSVEYARGLAGRGHQVVVFAQSVRRESADEGIEFVRIHGPRSNKAMRAAVFPIAATRAVNHAGRLDNLIAFGSSVTVPAVHRVPGCHRSWWEVASREWPITTWDGLRRRFNPHHHIVLAWDKRILGGETPRAVLAAGSWAADDIALYYPQVAPKVSILPDGVNLEEFSFDAAGRQRLRDGWESHGAPVLFILATEQRRKGLDTLFDAFRLVRDERPDAQLVVGGRVPAGDVRALAVRHHVEEGVRAIGFVEDVRAAYSAADVLVFPTRFDPWGLPIVEALACGTPVAASARAGAAAALRPRETGAVILNAADPREVARAALEALSLKTDRAEVRETVTPYAWSTVIDGLEQVLQRTASH